MKNINYILKSLFLILILFSNTVSGQERFIGEKFNELNHTELLSTRTIGDQKVTFVENHFTLNVDKLELLNSLKNDTILLDDKFKHIYEIVINYLNKSDNLVFDFIWTKAEDFDDISWFETEKLGEINLTKKILKESLCALIDLGKFELNEDGQSVEEYFFERIDSNYGGNVKGAFSTSKRLIWICPPFIMD